MIEFHEHRLPHKDFALDDAVDRFGELERDRQDGAYIVRDIFADGAVAARCTPNKFSLYVLIDDLEAVDLELAHIRRCFMDARFFEKAPHPLVKCLDVFNIKYVVE